MDILPLHIGAIVANGECIQFHQWYTSSTLAPMAIVIGTIEDRFWSPLVPFKWRQWRHSMVMLRPLSPLNGRGAIGGNGDDTVNGDNGDPLVTMGDSGAIGTTIARMLGFGLWLGLHHCRHWHYCRHCHYFHHCFHWHQWRYWHHYRQ